jgi:recombination protein RecA
MVEENNTKREQVNLAIAALEKDFGKGIISKEIPGTEFLTTGCLSLDKILGGGYAKGRMVEIYGGASAGKSTLSLHAIAECQKLGGITALVDTEMSLDPFYASNLGVDMEKLIISQPQSAEQALDVVDKLVHSGGVSLVVVDSVAAMVCQKELDGEMGDSVMGLNSRLMSQAMRKLTGGTSKTNSIIIWINQIRNKIGIVYGNPEVTTGGNALGFYASQRLDIRRKKTITNGSGDDAEIIGNKTTIKCVKNKCAPPYRECEVDIMYGRGIDKDTDLIRLAVDKDIVKKCGAGWHSYGELKIGQGEENVKEYFLEHPEVKEEIINKVKEVK